MTSTTATVQGIHTLPDGTKLYTKTWKVSGMPTISLDNSFLCNEHHGVVVEGTAKVNRRHG